jgi:uncharacterized membrane protein
VPPVVSVPGEMPSLSALAAQFGLTVLLVAFFFLGRAALLVAATDLVAGRPVGGLRCWLRVLDPRVLGTMAMVWTACLIGFVLCILPGLFLWLQLALVLPVMAGERCYGFGAVRRSFQLMSHNPRRDFIVDPRVRVFLLVVAGFLIGYACNFLVQLPLMVAMMFLMFRGVAGGVAPDANALMRDLLWLQVPSSILSTLLQTVVGLYVSFGVALLYFDVRHRKEGDDLLAGAEAVEGHRETTP